MSFSLKKFLGLIVILLSVMFSFSCKMSTDDDTGGSSGNQTDPGNAPSLPSDSEIVAEYECLYQVYSTYINNKQVKLYNNNTFAIINKSQESYYIDSDTYTLKCNSIQYSGTYTCDPSSPNEKDCTITITVTKEATPPFETEEDRDKYVKEHADSNNEATLTSNDFTYKSVTYDPIKVDVKDYEVCIDDDLYKNIKASPTLIQSSSTNKDNLYVSWCHNERFSSYKLYYNTTNEFSTALCIDVPTTSLKNGKTVNQQISTAVAGTKYYCWLVAIRSDGTEAIRSLPITAKMTGIPTPSIDSIIPSDNNQIKLYFYKSSTSTYTYKLYRNTTNDAATATCINENAFSASSDYYDTITESGTYYYWLTACSGTDESNFSAVVYTTITYYPVTKPEDPYTIYSPSSSTISLHWTKPSKGTPTAYDIYCSTTSNGEYTKVKTVDGTATSVDITPADNPANSTLLNVAGYKYFKIKAVAGTAESLFSNKTDALVYSKSYYLHSDTLQNMSSNSLVEYEMPNVANTFQGIYISFESTANKEYYIKWADAGEYGEETFTGTACNIKVSGNKSNSGNKTFEETDNGYTNPQTLCSSSTTSSFLITPAVPGSTGKFKIAIYEKPITPTDLSSKTMSATSLYEDQITTTSQIKKYSFPVKQGKTYAIIWADKYQYGNEKFTGDSIDVKVSAEYSNGTSIFSPTDAGYNTPQEFKPTSDDTITITVIPYNLGYTGYFKIAVYEIVKQFTNLDSISMNEFNLYEDQLTSSAPQKYYTYTVEKDKTYYIKWADAGQYGTETFTGTKATVQVSVKYSNGTSIYTNYTNRYYSPISFKAASNDTITITVAPESTTKTGYFKIAVFERPAISLDPTTMSESSMYEDSLTTASTIKYYTYPMQSGKYYIIKWADSKDNGGVTFTGTAADIKVSVFDANNNSIFFNDIDSGYTNTKSHMCRYTGNMTIAVTNNGTTENTGYFKLAIYEPVVTPTSLASTTMNATTMYEDSLTSTAPVKKYTYPVQEGKYYFIKWADSFQYGEETFTGTDIADVMLSAEYSNGDSITTATDSGYNTPIYFKATSTENIIITVNAYGNDIGSFKIAVYEFVITPTDLSSTTMSATNLQEDSLTSSAPIKAYTYSVEQGKKYSIKWADSHEYNQEQFTGSKASVSVSAVNSEGTSIFSNKTYGYNTPQAFTAASTGTITITVEPSYTGNTGYYKIAVYEIPVTDLSSTPMNAKTMYEDQLTTTDSIKYYSFSVEKDKNYLIQCADYYQYGSETFTGTKAWVSVSAEYSDGESIFSNYGGIYSTPKSFTATSNDTITITVKPYSSNGNNIGYYKIAVYDITTTSLANTTMNSSTLYEAYLAYLPTGSTLSSTLKYTYPVEQGKIYSVKWADNYQYGSETFIGSKARLSVSAEYSDGTSIFSHKTYGYNTPQNFTATSTGTITITVNGYSSNETGWFKIAVYEKSSINLSAFDMSETEMHEDQLTTTEPEKYYSYPVEQGKSYYIKWADSYEGNSAITHTPQVDVKVSAVNSNGTSIFSDKDSGYNTPQTFTAASTGTITITVNPYTTGYTGYFAISVYELVRFDLSTIYNLDASTLYEDQITTTEPTKYYSYPVEQGKKYFIKWADSGNYGSEIFTGSKVDVKVSAINSDGTSIFSDKDSGYNTPQTFTAASTGTITITVNPYSTGKTGYFKIAVYEKIVTNLKYVAMSKENMYEDSLTTTDPVKYYSYPVTEGKIYAVRWADKDQSAYEKFNNTTLADIYVSAAYDDGTTIFDKTVYGYEKVNYFKSTKTGLIYVDVDNYSSSYATGSFKICVFEVPVTDISSLNNMNDSSMVEYQISNTDPIRIYSFNVKKDKHYRIKWANYQSSGSETFTDNLKARVQLSAGYSDDAFPSIFANTEVGYNTPKDFVSPKDDTIYIVVQPSISGEVSTAYFKLAAYELPYTNLSSTTMNATTMVEKELTAAHGSQFFTFDVVKDKQYILRWASKLDGSEIITGTAAKVNVVISASSNIPTEDCYKGYNTPTFFKASKTETITIHVMRQSSGEDSIGAFKLAIWEYIVPTTALPNQTMDKGANMYIGELEPVFPIRKYTFTVEKDKKYNIYFDDLDDFSALYLDTNDGAIANIKVSASYSDGMQVLTTTNKLSEPISFTARGNETITFTVEPETTINKTGRFRLAIYEDVE